MVLGRARDQRREHVPRLLHPRFLLPPQEPHRAQRGLQQRGPDVVVGDVEQAGHERPVAACRCVRHDQAQRSQTLREPGVRRRIVRPSGEVRRAGGSAGLPAQLAAEHLLAHALVAEGERDQRAVHAEALPRRPEQHRHRHQLLHGVQPRHPLGRRHASIRLLAPTLHDLDGQAGLPPREHLRRRGVQRRFEPRVLLADVRQVGAEDARGIEPGLVHAIAARPGFVKQVQVQRIQQQRLDRLGERRPGDATGSVRQRRGALRVRLLPLLRQGEGPHVEPPDVLLLGFIVELREVTLVGEDAPGLVGEGPPPLEHLVRTGAHRHDQAQPRVALDAREDAVYGGHEVGEAVGLVDPVEEDPHPPVFHDVRIRAGMQFFEQFLNDAELRVSDAGAHEHRIEQHLLARRTRTPLILDVRASPCQVHDGVATRPHVEGGRCVGSAHIGGCRRGQQAVHEARHQGALAAAGLSAQQERVPPALEHAVRRVVHARPRHVALREELATPDLGQLLRRVLSGPVDDRPSMRVLLLQPEVHLLAPDGGHERPDMAVALDALPHAHQLQSCLAHPVHHRDRLAVRGGLRRYVEKLGLGGEQRVDRDPVGVCERRYSGGGEERGAGGSDRRGGELQVEVRPVEVDRAQR